MRRISFMHTAPQVRNRTKTVTRRRGWKNLKPGTLLQACLKFRGLKASEVVTLATIRVVTVRRERLDCVTAEDVVKEGYPGMSPAEFIATYCKQMKCLPQDEVTRIEFDYC